MALIKRRPNSPPVGAAALGIALTLALLGRTGTDTTEGVWQNALVDYIAVHDLYWTYWCWNPNSGDTGGVLNDDWTTVNQAKQTMLQGLIDDDFAN